ncbi:MAG: hypothetical protein IPL79_05560 [Myxococcales bacterium]|nr:hypothetical protein [Myxococcales bacterium]
MAALCGVVALASACHARKSPAAARREAAAAPLTADERVVALLPAGAQLVIEFDMKRLRAHPLLGDLWGTVAEVLKSVGTSKALTAPGLGAAFDPVLDADLLVVGAYDIGSPAARTVTLSRGSVAPPGGILVAEGIYAVGPDGMVGEMIARATAPGTLPAAFRALRQAPMPAGATGAIMRATGRWPKTSAIDLQGFLGTSVVPTDVALWFDAVDDAALVVHAHIDDELARSTFVSSLQAAAAAMATAPWARGLMLSKALASAKVGQRDADVIMVILVGPRRLTQVAIAMRKQLALWQLAVKTSAQAPTTAPAAMPTPPAAPSVPAATPVPSTP